MKNAWFKEHLTDGKSSLPFSFTYDGRPSPPLLAEWPVKVADERLDANRTRRTLAWTDPKTGLEVRCVAVDYADYPAVEWTAYFKNTGTSNTPILENIQGLDTRFDAGAKGEFVLHGIKGDFQSAESYEPYRRVLAADTTTKFAPPGTGKPCDGPDGWPYFNLQTTGGGTIIAVGWPGQWASTFERDKATALRVRAGQELTHLYLKPGEEIRTPLIALLFWQGGDVVESQNLWRRWYRAYNLPRIERKPQSAITFFSGCGTEKELPIVQSWLDAGIHLDVFWRDAGGAREHVWWPLSPDPLPYQWPGMYWMNSGTWTPDPQKFPKGFKPVSDWLRARGIQFMLWFEPERVGDPNSWLGKNHPEWLLPNDRFGTILDEGNPAARQWLTDHICGMIESQGLDWYREDMNGGGPCPGWRKNDAPNRQGITENLYVQGHLAFWDELRRRHPRLHIDSCASGGRRNDLETMRRAVPLLRSDYTMLDSNMADKLAGVVDDNQCHTYGISAWLPFHGSCVSKADPYVARSHYVPCFGAGLQLTPENQAAVRRIYAECRQVARFVLEGDYYPLTPYSRASGNWIAWQFNRPEEGDGVVQVFRRSESPYVRGNFRLRGLDPAAMYEVTNFDVEGSIKVSGKDLMENGLPVEIKDKPGAAVIMYRRLVDMKALKLKTNVALLAEQVVSAGESDSPRRAIEGIDCTGDFDKKLKYLDKAEVSVYWLYGFRSAEGTMRDIGLLKAAKEKLERLGKEAYIVCEPVGHPDPNQKALPAKGWCYRINCDGTPDYGCADIEENLVHDLVAATKAFRDAGFKKVFFDDDLRLGSWGSNITGCFCEACIADFNRRQGTRYTREDLRRFVQNPGEHAALCEQWMDFNCAKVTAFMKAVNLPGIQVGIMVMHNGDRKHGVDLPAILKAVPGCLVRVGEGHFCDNEFNPPAGKAFSIQSLEMHKAIVKDVARLYSENTVHPWPNLRPENMAKRLLIEVEHGLRNIMLMPPQLLDAPEYWEAIAKVLPEAKALAAKQANVQTVMKDK